MRKLTPREKAQLLAHLPDTQIDLLKDLAPNAKMYARKGHVEVMKNHVNVRMLNIGGDIDVIQQARREGVTEQMLADALHITRRMVIYYVKGQRPFNLIMQLRVEWILHGTCYSLDL